MQLIVAHVTALSAQRPSVMLSDFFAGMGICVDGPLTLYRTSVAPDPLHALSQPSVYMHLSATQPLVEHAAI